MVAMVALPIAALAGGASVIATVIPTPNELATDRMGSAAIVVDSWPTDHDGNFDPTNVRRHLPTGTRLVSESLASSQDIVHGSYVYATIEELDAPIDRPPVRGMFTIVSGRAPRSPGEAAVDPRTLAAMRAHVGGSVSFDDLHLTLRVTGTIVRPGQVNDPVVVAGSGTLPAGLATNYGAFFVEAPPSLVAVAEARLRGAGLGFSTREEVRAQDRTAGLVATAASFGATAAVLFATGLIAAAAMAVGARRQLRTIGLLVVIGGSRPHARAVVVLGGSSLGLVGSVVGVALGLIGAAILHHWLPGLAGREVGPVAVPRAALAGTVLLGTVAGTLAAWGPARAAARIPVAQALAGRWPVPRPPGRAAGTGAIGWWPAAGWWRSGPPTARRRRSASVSW